MNTELLLSNLRSIPDFPIPGILFRDVTTLFKSAECLKEMEDTLYEMYKNKGYADLKKDVADAIIDELAPIQEKVNSLLKDKKALEEIYKLGAEKANYAAIKTLRKMQKKIGLIPR